MSFNSALMVHSYANRLADVALVHQWLQTQPANDDAQRWWLWLLLFVLLILFVWWLLHSESAQPSAQPSVSQPVQPKASVPFAPVVLAPITNAPVTTAPVAGTKVAVSPSLSLSIPVTEDLIKIEGIGPKINGVLHAAGIKTFADLSKAEVGQLRQILVGVGMKVNDPTTWPEQAALAATGDWAGLRKLQEQLNGGRRV
jgi:predicted flap endonuclease-1-like 5' DNA nuclease